MISATASHRCAALARWKNRPLFPPDRAPIGDYQEETTMLKLSLIGIAAVAATTAFAVPAFAQHRTAPVNAYAQADRCTHDAGNPFSKEEDYMAWSAWRARGGWDDRIDPNCLPSRPSRFGF
jgi:hypothetical protein